MQKPKITSENWTSSHFFSDPLRAFVSLGAAPKDDGKEVEIHYLVTLTDKDYQELYQSLHKSLDEALNTVNEKYGDWELKVAGQKSGDGCDSCAAH